MSMAALQRRRIALATPVITGSINISIPLEYALVVPGGNVSRTITLTRNGGYTGDVALSVTGLPTGVTGSFSPGTLTGVTLQSVLTLTAAADAPEVSLDAFVVIASGAGVSDATCDYAVTVADVVGSHFFRPETLNIELPRGVTSNHDVLFDEATRVISTVGGADYSPVWDWKGQRVGSARHLAASQIPVTSMGGTGWTEFLAAVNTFIAGSGDFEILVPASLTMSGMWTVPSGPGMTDRRLFITATLGTPTADIMPSISALNSASVWTGMAGTSSSLIAMDAGNCAGLTLTGIVLRPQNQIATGIVDMRATTTMTTVDDVPKGLVIDRCHLTGEDTSDNCRRGVLLNGRMFAILETWITHVRSTGTETAGYGGWNGLAHGFLRNVLSESLSIGALMGGADPDQPNTGTFDPCDLLEINVACTKKSSWMTESGGGAAAGVKNGFECKNMRRRFTIGCMTRFHANTGQSHALLAQTLSDGNTNLLYSAVHDWLIIDHEFVDCQNGINLLARVAYADGTVSASSSGTSVVAAGGYNTLQASDDVYNGKTLRVIEGTSSGQERLITDYVGSSKTFTLGSALTVDGSSRVRVLDSPLPDNQTARVAAVNVRMKGLGKNHGAGGYKGNPFFLQSDLHDVAMDHITWIVDDGVEDLLRLAGSGAVNIELTNLAGRSSGIFADGGGVGLTALALFCEDVEWDGNSMYGPFMYGGTHTPGLTQYNLGGALSADAAAMGFDEVTGEISGAGANDGLGGGTPGCDHTILDAAIADMQSWALSR